MRDLEAIARDEAMAKVQANPLNHADELYNFSVGFISGLERGSTITANDVRTAAKAAGLFAEEDRVFGPIMTRMRKAGLIESRGFTTEGRSHKGLATLWEVQ